MGSFSANLYAFELKVLTENLAPFNYVENGKVTGFSTEIVEQLLTRTGIKTVRGKILFWPWKRAYQAALEEDNVLLFTTTRTLEREKLFKWVGPIYPRQQWIYKLKNRTDIQVHSLEETKQYKFVAIYDSANYQFLLKQGFEPKKNLFTANTMGSKYNMFLSERIDLALFLPLEIAYWLKKNDKNVEVEPLFLASGELWYYLAFSQGVPDKVVAQFQQALDTMKQDGSYELLLQRYMNYDNG